MSDGSIRVLLADGHSLFREAVRVVFQVQPDILVVGEATDGDEAVSAAMRLHPDVVFVSAKLGRDPLSTLVEIREQVPGCRVVVLSHELDDELLLQAVCAGASGFVTMEVPLSELIESARAVHRGETLVPPQMLGSLLERLTRRRRDQDDALRKISRLTQREREVLALLVEGADNQVIAGALTISPQTARTHVQNLLGKLDVHSRLEAAAYVRRVGEDGELIPRPRFDDRVPAGADQVRGSRSI